VGERRRMRVQGRWRGGRVGRSMGAGSMNMSVGRSVNMRVHRSVNRSVGGGGCFRGGEGPGGRG